MAADNEVIVLPPLEDMGTVTQEVLKRERYWDEASKSYTDGNGDPVKGLS